MRLIGKIVWWLGMAGFAVVVLAIVFGPDTSQDREAEGSRSAQAISTPAAPRPPTDAERAAAAMPSSQQAFVRIVAAARAAYSAAPNDMAKGATRTTRGSDICRAMPSRAVANWTGTIDLLSSNSDGKGVLRIEIARDVTVGTWNNALSDVGDRTLLDPGDPVARAAMVMQRRQAVRFSGTFFRGDPDCFRESSITQSGSMTDPVFIFRFSELSLL